jgi:hypothetical protein
MQSRLFIEILSWEAQVIGNKRRGDCGLPEGIIVRLPDEGLVWIRQELRGA